MLHDFINKRYIILQKAILGLHGGGFRLHLTMHLTIGHYWTIAQLWGYQRTVESMVEAYSASVIDLVQPYPLSQP